MFKLSKKSLGKLEDVHPALVQVVQRAIQLTEVDFAVHEGLRTKARQAELVKNGASWTMDSRHITGHAVDLVPWVGELRWDWPLCYKVASAVKQAAKELGVQITWGGVWDKPLTELGDEEDEVAAYVARRLSKGKKAKIDGPHFELDRNYYHGS